MRFFHAEGGIRDVVNGQNDRAWYPQRGRVCHVQDGKRISESVTRELHREPDQWTCTGHRQKFDAIRGGRPRTTYVIDVQLHVVFQLREALDQAADVRFVTRFAASHHVSVESRAKGMSPVSYTHLTL